MLKKKILLTLIISLLAVSPVMQGFAQNVTNYEETETPYEGEALIDKLGIISPGTDLNSDYVTREVFALYIARMLRIDETQPSDIRYFSDVEYDSFSASAINALAEKGIISVPDDHIFRPGGYVTQDEALKMLVCVLGYGTMAEYDGGYPYGYIKTARKLDIDTQCENVNLITVAEAGNMIYNAMRAKVYSVGSVTLSQDGTYTTSQESDETFLEVYWDISETEGCVEAVYDGNIIKDVYDIKENEAIISGVKYELEDGLDLSGYLGNYIRCFYNIKEKDRCDKIIVVEKCSGVEDAVIDFDDFEKMEGEQISYYDSTQKLVTKKLFNPVVVYNGSVLGENFSAVIEAVNKGKITLKDSDKDKKYDVVIIEDYRGFVISSLNSSGEVIYDKVGLMGDVDLTEYEVSVLFNSKGEKITFSDLAVGQVLSVAASKDKKYIKIIHETDTFTGTFNAIKTNDETVEITIDGDVFVLDKTFVGYFNDNCSFNSEYTFTLDSFGKIVYAEVPGEVLEYGYIIGGYLNETGLSSATVIKLINKSGEVKIYECAEKLTLDGIERKSNEVFGLLTNSTGNIQQVIRYSLSDDFIKKIDTKNVGDESTRTSMYNIFEGNERTRRWYNSLRLGLKCLLNSSTVIFCVPDDLSGSDDKDYFLVKSGELASDSFYVSDAYKDGSIKSYAGAVVIYYDSLIGWGNDKTAQKKVFVVEEISEQLYNDEIVTAIEGYERGTKRTVYDDEGMDFSGVEKGDLLRFGYDRDGTLRRINDGVGYELIYDRSSKAAPVPNDRYWFNTATLLDVTADPATGCLVYNKGGVDTEYYRSDYQISYGEVLAKKDTTVEWNGTGGDTYTDSADLAGLPIVVFDEASDTVAVGSIDDIIDRESSGQNNSKIFFEQSGGMGRAAVIYNFK